MTETAVRYAEDGLVPCIIQDVSGEVRMLAYMNAESLEKTRATGKVTFFSRSRQKLWTKGETSGHVLDVVDLRLDCDGDTILVQARCSGPTCHRNTPSCFSREGEDASALVPSGGGVAFLEELEDILRTRKVSKRADGSYTERLFFQGIDRIAKKVVEEAGEVVIAAKTLDACAGREGEQRDVVIAAARAELLGEAADLLFHLDMLLVHHGSRLADAVQVLDERHRRRTNDPTEP